MKSVLLIILALSFFVSPPWQPAHAQKTPSGAAYQIYADTNIGGKVITVPAVVNTRCLPGTKVTLVTYSLTLPNANVQLGGFYSNDLQPLCQFDVKDFSNKMEVSGISYSGPYVLGTFYVRSQNDPGTWFRYALGTVVNTTGTEFITFHGPTRFVSRTY